MTAQDKINLYGMQGYRRLADMGAVQRGIESEGITADRLQFEEERDFPYKQVQYMQSLLQGLPIGAQTCSMKSRDYYKKCQQALVTSKGFLKLFGYSVAQRAQDT